MKTMLKKHFRVLIQKDECLNRLRYFPQMRYLWLFWTNLFEWPIISFSNYESAYECVKQYILKYGIVNYDYQVVDNNGGIENMKYKDSTLQSLFKSVGVCVTDEGKITQVFIIKSQVDKEKYDCYIGFDLEENDIFPEGLWMIDRFALEEEKEELLNIIKNQPEWLQKLEALATKTDEMIEGLVEEETKPKFKVGDEVRIKGTDIGGTIERVIRGQLIVNSKGSKIPAWPEDVVLMKSVEEETKPNIIEEAKTYWDSIKDAWICPEGYVFKDENGNIINAQKIVLEKKKNEYPKTFEECVHVLEGENRMSLEQMNTFRKLIDARNAYWKIYGEENGLGKPWEPDWTNEHQVKYTIYTMGNDVIRHVGNYIHAILAFPTKEMRDAFYENFKSEIESCKELL